MMETPRIAEYAKLKREDVADRGIDERNLREEIRSDLNDDFYLYHECTERFRTLPDEPVEETIEEAVGTLHAMIVA